MHSVKKPCRCLCELPFVIHTHSPSKLHDSKQRQRMNNGPFIFLHRNQNRGRWICQNLVYAPLCDFVSDGKGLCGFVSIYQIRFPNCQAKQLNQPSQCERVFSAKSRGVKRTSPVSSDTSRGWGHGTSGVGAS